VYQELQGYSTHSSKVGQPLVVNGASGDSSGDSDDSTGESYPALGIFEVRIWNVNIAGNHHANLTTYREDVV